MQRKRRKLNPQTTPVYSPIYSVPKDVLVNHIFDKLTPRELDTCCVVCKAWRDIIDEAVAIFREKQIQWLERVIEQLKGNSKSVV